MYYLDEKPLGLRATNGIRIKVRWVVGLFESSGIYEGRNSVFLNTSTFMG